jgi:hypothetical protein
VYHKGFSSQSVGQFDYYNFLLNAITYAVVLAYVVLCFKILPFYVEIICVLVLAEENRNLFVVLYVARVVVRWSDGYEVSPYLSNALHFLV